MFVTPHGHNEVKQPTTHHRSAGGMKLASGLLARGPDGTVEPPLRLRTAAVAASPERSTFPNNTTAARGLCGWGPE